MTAPDTSIRSMALSGNGEVLAAAGSINTRKGWKLGSGTIYLWNARTAKPLTTITPVYTRDRKGFTHGFDIYALTLSPDAKQIGFTRAAQKLWALYDTATQNELWRFPSFISDAEFSRDGRFIALSSDTHISIVNASDGRVRIQWKRNGSTKSHDLAWSHDGVMVASIGSYKANDSIEVHRVDNGKLVRRIKRAHIISGETTASVKFSPDGTRLVIAAFVGNYSSTDNFNLFAPVQCYEVATGRLLWEVKAPAFGGVNGSHVAFCDAIFSPDGLTVAAYQFYDKGKVFLLDSTTGAIKKTLQLGRVEGSGYFVPPGLAFSPDGKRLFARGKSAVGFWDLE